MTTPPISAADLEAEVRPEIDRLKEKMDALALAVREEHEKAVAADQAGDYPRAAAHLVEVEQLQKRCSQASRDWLRLVVKILNAKANERGSVAGVDTKPLTDVRRDVRHGIAGGHRGDV